MKAVTLSRLSAACFVFAALASCGVEEGATDSAEGAPEASQRAALAGEPGTAALTWYQLGRDNCYDVWGMACNGTHPVGARCSSAVAGQPCSTPIASCYKVATPWFTEFECR